MFNTALHPVLLFGCANLNIGKRRLLELDKQLAKLVTEISYWVTKVVQKQQLDAFSLGTEFISTAVFMSQLSTLKPAIHGTSQARHFYRFLLSKHHLV